MLQFFAHFCSQLSENVLQNLQGESVNQKNERNSAQHHWVLRQQAQSLVVRGTAFQTVHHSVKSCGAKPRLALMAETMKDSHVPPFCRPRLGVCTFSHGSLRISRTAYMLSVQPKHKSDDSAFVLWKSTCSYRRVRILGQPIAVLASEPHDKNSHVRPRCWVHGERLTAPFICRFGFSFPVLIVLFGQKKLALQSHWGQKGRLGLQWVGTERYDCGW